MTVALTMLHMMQHPSMGEQMIKTPPQHNTKNPPGQVVYDKMEDGCCHKTVIDRCKDCSYADVPPGNPRPRGLYIRDVIKRIQGEEGPQEPMKLPTPIAGPAKALADLVEALERACGAVEHYEEVNRPKWPLYPHTPSIRTAVIRRIIKENT
jgi:hypothetical protein